MRIEDAYKGLNQGDESRLSLISSTHVLTELRDNSLAICGTKTQELLPKSAVAAQGIGLVQDALALRESVFFLGEYDFIPSCESYLSSKDWNPEECEF